MTKKTQTGNGEVDWFGAEVLLQLGNLTREGLEAIAHEVAAQAVVNITAHDQVDTGFMRNTVYVVTRADSTYAQASPGGLYAWNPQKHAGQDGQAIRDIAPEADLPASYDALVCVGADYAIFQELQQPFLYPALQQVQTAVGGILQQKANEQGVQ